MIKSVIFVLSAYLLQAKAISLSSDKNGRIVGGGTAFAGEFPYLAAIQERTSNGSYFCIGTLINNQWILTAGQCVAKEALFTIRLGSNHLNETDPNSITVATELSFLHPDFNATTLENDVGLLKLRQSIGYSDYIRPIHSVLRTEVPANIPVFIAGWGQTSDDAPGLSDQLYTTSLVTLTNEECKNTYGSQITDNMMCAAGNLNEGICKGDIGGPLIRKGASLHYHVGIASFVSGRGCENTDPSGFTRTGPYVEWIEKVIEDNTT